MNPEGTTHKKDVAPAKRLASSYGQSLTEFSVALGLLLTVALVMLDLGLVALRLALATDAIDRAVKDLSVSERLSSSFAESGPTGPLSKSLASISGVNCKSSTICLCASSTTSANQSLVIASPGNIPRQWLPDGSQHPTYELSLTLKLLLDPMLTISLGDRQIPGLNAPIAVTIQKSAHWGNLGKDPSSKEYFLNE